MRRLTSLASSTRIRGLLVAALAISGCATHTLRDFTTDGCSMFPDGDTDGPSCWVGCCVAHDRAYWRGGTASEREAADLALRECVTRTGRPVMASLMYRGARLGGVPWLPTGFRWGYGWSYGRGYAPLTAEEQRQADAQLAPYLRVHPGAPCDRE